MRYTKNRFVIFIKIALKISHKKSANIAQKINQIIIWLIGITLALVPFLFSAHSVFAGMIFAKTMLFWGLVTLLVVLYCILICLDQNYAPKLSTIGWLFMGLILMLLLSTITSIQPYTSFWGTVDRTDGLMSWLYYFAFFVVVAGTVRTKQDWQLVVNLSTLGILLVAISALYLFGVNIIHLSTNNPISRVEGTLGNPVFLGGYLAIVLPLLLAYVLSIKKTSTIKLILKLALILGYVTLLLTFSRGAWIAGIIASVTVLVFYLKQRQKPIFRLSKRIITVLGIVGIFLLLGGLSFNQQFSSLWQTKIANSQSLAYRLHIWGVGLKSFQEKPLLGWGLENFKIAFDQNFKQPKETRSLPFGETHADRAHNEYIDMAVTGGFVTIIVYLLLMLGAITIGIKKLPTLKDQSYLLTIGFIGSLLAYLVFAMTAFHLVVNFLWVLLALAYINNLDHGFGLPDISKSFSRTLSVIIIMIMIVSSYFTIASPVLAVNMAQQGTIKFVNGEVDESLAYFKRSLEYQSLASNTIRAQMAVLAINTSKVNNQTLSSNNFHKYLNNSIKNSFLTEPLNSHYHLLFGLYNGKFAQLNPSMVKLAEYHFQKCAELSPRRGEVYLWWVKMYNSLGDKTRAEIKLERALKVAPTSDTVSAFAGFFYMLNGETAKGTLMLQKTLALRPNTPPDLIEGLSGLINDLGPAEELQKIKIFYSELSDET